MVPSVPGKSWLITGVGFVIKVLNKVIYNYPISGTMSTRYKFIDNNAVNFTTSTVVGWTDIFTREMYKTILLDCVRHCQQSQGLKIHAWVLMTNPARMTGRTGIYKPVVVVKKGSITTNTIYVRDASGNIITVYTKNAAINSGSLTQTEISMYGSSRLGVWNPNRNVATLAAIDYAAYSSTFIRGNKGFELTNHLGNVLVTVSDKKIGVDAAPADGIIDYYTADVVTANDYYPFGMARPGRKYSNSAGAYRYGFSGQEKSTEINSESYTAEFWQYDSRIGRRFNLDPKPNISISPYAAFENNPIWFRDVLGDSIVDPNRTKGYNVFIVPTKTMREGDKAYTADYKRIQKFAKNNPNNVIIIEADDPEKAINDLQVKLGTDGYVKNMLIDYHAGSFGYKSLNGKESERAMNDLANGYIGLGSNVYLGNCWAGGNDYNKDVTGDYSKWSDKTTVYGGKTEAKSAGFKLFGDFTRMSWTLNFTPGGKDAGLKESEKKFAGQHGVSFYNPALKRIVSMDIKNTVKFNADGAINDTSPQTLQKRYESTPAFKKELMKIISTILMSF